VTVEVTAHSVKRSQPAGPGRSCPGVARYGEEPAGRAGRRMPKGSQRPARCKDQTHQSKRTGRGRGAAAAAAKTAAGLKTDHNEGNNIFKCREHEREFPSSVQAWCRVTHGLHGTSSPRWESEAARASGAWTIQETESTHHPSQEMTRPSRCRPAVELSARSRARSHARPGPASARGAG
jgi:hypothetical protein